MSQIVIELLMIEQIIMDLIAVVIIVIDIFVILIVVVILDKNWLNYFDRVNIYHLILSVRSVLLVR